MGDAALKILILSAEVAPFVRGGSLAEAARELPTALAAQGHDVRIVMPYYRAVAQQAGSAELVAPIVPIEGVRLPDDMPGAFALRRASMGPSRIPVYFIDQPAYYDRDGIYGDGGGDYADNGDRFAFLALAAFAACRAVGFRPHVLHANDWHAGFAPIYLRHVFGSDAFFARTGSLFTVHNLAYQGLFPEAQFRRTGLPEGLFTSEGLEFYGQFNTLKGALLFSDRLNTLSTRYAEEIRGPEYGCGLDGVLRERRCELTGIPSGLNTEEWNPAADPHLPASYDADHPQGKAEVKRRLREELGLPPDDVPLAAMVTRLDPVKGLGLVEEIADYLMHLDMQFVLMGQGDPRIQEVFQRLAETYPERAAVRFVHDPGLAHRVVAGADIFITPSRFEPSGRNQFIALRYGTVPVVRSVGGLADAVRDYDSRSGAGNGFSFSEYNSMALFNALQRALEVYRDREAWDRLRRAGMSEDHSWAVSARSYADLFREIAALRA